MKRLFYAVCFSLMAQGSEVAKKPSSIGIWPTIESLPGTLSSALVQNPLFTVAQHCRLWGTFRYLESKGLIFISEYLFPGAKKKTYRATGND